MQRWEGESLREHEWVLPAGSRCLRSTGRAIAGSDPGSGNPKARRGDTEIDLVALNEDATTVRFGSCKRSSSKLVSDIPRLKAHSERFLAAHSRYRDWRIEHVSIAPSIDEETREAIRRKGCIPQDLPELLADLP